MILRNYEAYNYKVHACVYKYMEYNLYHSQATIPTLSDQVLTPTHTFIMTSPSLTVPTQSTDKGNGVLLVYISAGVIVAVVVLVTTAVTVISVSVYLRKKKKDKHVKTTENVAYHYGTGNGLEMMQVNEAYGSVDAVSPTNNTDILTSVNDAYLAMYELGQSEEHQYATIPATIV